MRIPMLLLRQLYSLGSLTNDADGYHFTLKNRLQDVTIKRLLRVQVDGLEIPLARLSIEMGSGARVHATELTPASPASFPLRETARVHAADDRLAEGEHEIAVAVETDPFGRIELRTKDTLTTDRDGVAHIPYSDDDAINFSSRLATERRRFIEERTGATLTHVGSYSFDAAQAKGHAENFAGVAQVPLGFAGPLLVHGEHAEGEFFVPLATSEGTLVASYSRGMKVLSQSGGVFTTISADSMQRAPVFVMASARDARDFVRWVDEHLDEIRRVAEATSHVARLLHIEPYLASRFAFLRFNFATGDAAGQNMVTKATFAACAWIAEHAPRIERMWLESNLATDKKASHINLLRTRGKRVTAEATVPREILKRHLRVEPETLSFHNQVANVGALLAGSSNNGLHSANGLTALFIACGMDVANVTESALALGHSEVTPTGDFYMSITIPSLIVGTHGGGTGLPTQHECLSVLGCTGPGTASKLAEIAAAVVLSGELSLAAAISSLEWVDAHERYGRHR